MKLNEALNSGLMDALITLVLVSRANLVTLESMAISEVKHDTGICRNIWPFSASREHNVNIKQLSYCNLPTMLTTRKPWSFWVVMMTGSSEYGSMTSRPWKSPETSGTASDADGRKEDNLTADTVNSPSLVTAMKLSVIWDIYKTNFNL